MVDKEELDGQTLGIAFWQKDENGKDDVRMSSGKCYLKNDQLFMLIGSLRKEIPIFDYWIARIKKLEDLKIKKIFHGSDYGLSLKVVDLPKDEDLKFYKELGLNLNI